jgi:hypothetical protein
VTVLVTHISYPRGCDESTLSRLQQVRYGNDAAPTIETPHQHGTDAP